MTGSPATPNGAPESFRDKLGRAFDAVKFRLGLDGKPRFDALGRFINARAGRKSKLKMETTSPEKPAAEPTPASPKPTAENDGLAALAAEERSAPPAPAPDFSDVKKALGNAPAGDESAAPSTADELADAVANIGDNPTADTVIGLIQTGLMLIGGDEGVLSPIEKQLIRRPLLRVMAKYNVGTQALPAEVDLAIAVLGLLASRLQKPKTAAFALKVKAWAINKWFSFRGAKMARDLAAEAPALAAPKSS